MVKKNKKGVDRSYKELLVQSSRKEGIRLLGSAVVIIRPLHKDGFVQYSGIFDADTFQSSIQSYRIQGSKSTAKDFRSEIDNITFRTIPINEQASLMNSIPNSLVNPSANKPAYGQYTSLGMYKTDKERPDYKPAFCRDLILFSSRETTDQADREMCATVRKAYKMKPRHDSRIETQKKSIKRSGEPSTSTPPPKKPRSSKQVTRLGAEDIRNAIDSMMPFDQPKEPDAESDDPYDLFVTDLIETGHFSWRIHNEQTDSYCMNNIDIDNDGKFQANNYVHTYRENEEYSCTCLQYSTVLQLASLAVSDDEIADVNELECVHIMFIKEYVEKFNEDSDDDSTVMRFIRQGRHHMNVGAVSLSSSSSKSKRFSVINLSHDKCSIVSLSGHYIKCHDGRCAAAHGHLRKLENLGSDAACEHLHTMHSFAEEFELLTMCADEEDPDNEFQDELEPDEDIPDSAIPVQDIPPETRKVGFRFI